MTVIMPSRNLDIGQAAGPLLAHIARYRLSTFAAISELATFASGGPRRVRQVLHHCRDEGLLASAALHHGTRYWYLTQRGADACDLTGHRFGPLSEPAKIRAYAVLLFCCLSVRSRQRITTDELTQSFPEINRPGMPGAYYLDAAGRGRIGLVRVDAGHRGRWDRVVQSIREDIAGHVRQPGFRRLVRARRFEITVLTVLPSKARRIESAIKSYPDTGCVPVHVVAQPELLPLIASSHGKDVRFRLPQHGFHRSRPGSTEKQRANDLSSRRRT